MGGGGGLLQPWRKARQLWQLAARATSYSTTSAMHTPTKSAGRILPPKSRLTWAGMLESDIRVTDLTDVGIWLQQLSRIAAVKEENIELPDMARRVSELEKRTADWRLPLSPEIAVMYAQDDLRKRFGMESRTERYMRRRKAELAAAKKLMEQKAKEMADEKKMQEYLASLDSTAAEAELMAYDKDTTKAIGDGEGDGGGSGFDEGDGRGTDYNSWTRHGEPYGRSEPSSGDGKRKISEKRKKGNLGRSGGRSGRGRRYGGVTSGLGSSNLFEKEKTLASCEYSVCSSATSSRGGEGGAASLIYDRRRQRSASAHRKFVDIYTGVSESEGIICCHEGEKKTLRTIAIETDCEMGNYQSLWI